MSFADRLFYAARGFRKRYTQTQQCPACGHPQGQTADRKFSYTLVRCAGCGLCYRFPNETPEELDRFYNRAYKQSGLTTDLPDDDALKGLLEHRFQGTEKDFSRVVRLFESLGVKRSARVLDFGANWGYGAWQLRQAGYAADGYELSKPRAAFGRDKLDIPIADDPAQLGSGYDVVFSSHVLEHIVNPAEAIERQLACLRPGGLLIGFTPNGSAARQAAQPGSFHEHWGRVHPVLLTEPFVAWIAKSRPYLVGSLPYLEDLPADLRDAIAGWNRTVPSINNVARTEFLLIIANA